MKQALAERVQPAQELRAGAVRLEQSRFVQPQSTAVDSVARERFRAGMAAADQGRIREGINQIGVAIAADPRPEYRVQLARLYTLVRRDGDAADLLRELEAVPPTDALSRDTMGCIYARLGDHAAALGHFVEAVRRDPANTSFRYNEAVTLNFLGQTAAAEAALERLIALAPGEARAHHLLSSLRRQSVAANHLPRLESALTTARSSRDRLLVGYAMAKELEDIGQAQAAMATLARVNSEHRRTLPYAFARDAASFDAVEAAWPLPEAGGAASTEAPIFIIGMPRTGTTLVDRIVSSHPEVESAGELQAMPLAVKFAAGTRTPTVMDGDTISAAAAADMAVIGQDYLARAQHHRRQPDLRFIDKFPGNFFYAGFIARALPQARIVCLRRHPLDTVLGNFRNLFATSSRYYDYSYDLLDIAAYYARFDRLMAHWRMVLPDQLIEVGYEDLVANQERESNRLLAHCGLDWSDACLSFHTNAAPVSTPSAMQVRRPIYSDSIGRWRQHGVLLEPARRFLEAKGIACD